MLNKDQQRAVDSDHPRILCLAGAGTGKTKTLTSRIARLYEDGVSTKNMLAVTFTRAGGQEMKERIIDLIGEDGESLFCNTFHAFAVKIIRQYGHTIGYKPNFSIYDNEDTLSIVTKIIEDMQYKVEPKKVLEAMDKNVVRNAPIPQEMRHIVNEYKFRCKQQNAIDLNSLISTLKKLLENETIRKLIQSQYEYIFVDEMQDTDPRQMEILNIINPTNLFIVGDDFQSIYGFRGADVSIIMGLAESEDYETIKLEENYRSTVQIVNAANRLIKHNNQTEKVLKAHRNGAEIVQITEQYPEEELEWIANKCLRLGYEESNYNTAILCRTNRQIDAVSVFLDSFNVPFQVRTKTSDILKYGSTRQLVAWIEASLNKYDNEAVSKIVNWPRETITRREFLKAEMYALEKECSLITAFEATGTAQEFLETYEWVQRDLMDPNNYTDALDVMQLIIDDIDIKEHYESLGLINRIRDIDDLISYMNEWRDSTMDNSAEDFLEFYKQRDIEPATIEEKKDAVQLMTVHGSKGLEFDNVIVMGCNQKSFPLNRADLKEERRLFYVAMTRAKNRLYLSRSILRKTWGENLDYAEPSQFLEEI